VSPPKRKYTGQEGETSCPVLSKPFRPFRRVGHGVGQGFDPHRDLREIMQKCNKKHPKSEDFRCFLELLGGFEPPTSSLPKAQKKHFSHKVTPNQKIKAYNSTFCGVKKLQKN